jgi:hypothetical protein
MEMIEIKNKLTLCNKNFFKTDIGIFQMFGLIEAYDKNHENFPDIF